MPHVYFSQLPMNVARSAFRDTITKYLQSIPGSSADGLHQFTVNLPIPDRPTAEHKHDGFGSVEFDEDTSMMEFWAKLKTEPIMFESKQVLFSREPPSPSLLATIHEHSSQARAERVAQIAQPASVAESYAPSANSTGQRMNLNRTRQRTQPERTGPRPENPRYERQLQHRLSALGQRARLVRLEFGVLRGRNFSVEYSRELLESGGDLSFEDDEKSLRIIMGGTHQDPMIPSVKIAIQTINYVALGDDFGTPYMFLELLQNPHFELGDASRASTGNAKDDARRSRTRHSALDPKHRRVAPYTSRWVKMTFYSDGFYPDRDLCLLAGLPLPDMNPNLTFNKYEKYSLRNIQALEKWFQGGSLPWEVAFQCEALFRNGTLVPQELLLLRPAIERITTESLNRACDALTSFGNEMKGVGAQKKLADFEDQNIVKMFENHVAETKKKAPIGRLRDGSSRSNFDCYHVKITPTAVFLTGFRDNACFYSADFVFEGSIVTPESIRTSLGNFSKVIHYPARYGARMSQAFSSTDPSITIPQSAIKPIPDIKTSKGDLEFSDGCGTISRQLAEEVWQGMIENMPHTRRRQRHRAEPTPCAFQIRIGGSKGMVRLDPKLKGRKLCLRPSMTKFDAPGEFALEIARAFERPSPCFLNRPLIMLMWTNGVESSVFESMMTNALTSTIDGMKTFGGAAKLLITNRLGRPFRLANTFEKLSRLQLEPDQAGVRTAGLHKLMNAGLYHIKIGLKHKARIPVPESYTLVGVCDEDNYLRTREIYACVQHFDHKTGRIDRHFLRGRMLVTRSPVIHPGDAQILWAIGDPPPGSPFEGEGNHLPNCVVFSTRGPRPVPNMLGGGDLDGVRIHLPNYFLDWLIPPHLYMPASYPTPKLKKIPTESTIDDIADFMIEYICNDALGAIAVNHLVIASSAELRARDENCMINAALHSKASALEIAPSSLVPLAVLTVPTIRLLISLKRAIIVLGKLFRAVDLSPQSNPARERVEAPQAPEKVQKLLASHVQKYGKLIKGTYLAATPWVQALLSRYISELNHICVSHTIASESSERVSEVEVMLGTNLESASEGSNLVERMKRLTDDLTSYVRLQLQGEEGDDPHEWLARAWRAYTLTSDLGDTVFGAFSFSWIALGSVLEALNKLDEKFLPDMGPIVPPFPTTAQSGAGQEDLDRFAPVDLDNWTWDDDPESEQASQSGVSNPPGITQEAGEVRAGDNVAGIHTGAETATVGEGEHEGGDGVGDSRRGARTTARRPMETAPPATPIPAHPGGDPHDLAHNHISPPAQDMHFAYFSNLPANVGPSAFHDAIFKYLQGISDKSARFLVDLDAPNRPPAERKHNGSRSLAFYDEDLLLRFWAKAAPRPENPIHERKLQHRLSALGQQARLERVEFGVLRGHTFSVEYSRELLESRGDLSFEDDEKYLRVIMGGTHQDPMIPSIKITIQNINSVTLGDDFGAPYLFLELLQNPHFELGNASRATTSDAENSRTRHSALDPKHRRVAPYTSRWLKISFYREGFHPDREICELAGLPPPTTNRRLTFSRLELYSLRHVGTLEKWLQGGSLPWEVAFQCEALFRNGVLVPQELVSLRPLVERLVGESPTRACDALRYLRSRMEGGGAPKRLMDFDPRTVIAMFEKVVKSEEKVPIGRLRDTSSRSNFMCHHVKITPTAIFLAGPFAEQSNRIIRRYPGFESHFIRVSFTDEGDTRSHLDFEVDTNAFSDARVFGSAIGITRYWDTAKQVCTGNPTLCRLTEIFISLPGFKEHACFFSSDFVFEGSAITPESIRSSLGIFPPQVIKCPARYGARMSQAFTSTDPSIIIPRSAITPLQELQTEGGDQEFSDGCGTISRQLAEEVWQAVIENMPHSRRRQRHKAEPTPCAFQIRIGGYKGMVRLDPKLTGRRLGLRPSMEKFDAPGELSLEIAQAFERPGRCFLNRPLIILMWTNGVDSSVFEDLMASTLESTVTGMKTLSGVAKLLVNHRLGHPFRLADTFNKLSRLSLELDQPGVRTAGLLKLMNASLYHIMVDLKHKARIPVPGGHTLVGVCDEENYLRPREIYACVQYFDHSTKKTHKQYLKGRMLVTRNPVIHPGDAQVLWAIGDPPPDSPFAGEGNDLANCVVFSTRGPRPVPNMLGGGDLVCADGDTFMLIPLPKLIPPYKYTPASYPKAKLETITEDSTIDDVVDFMIKAVDFIKTGKPVPPKQIRKPHNRKRDPITKMNMQPDWQAGHGRDLSDGRYYECDSVLGRLFRAVQLPQGNPAREHVEGPQIPEAIQKELTTHVGKYSEQIQETYLGATPWVRALLSRYISELNHICVSHTISSESSERVSEVEVMLCTNLEPHEKGDKFVERMNRLTHDLATF
ncbi:hypothetical protein FRC06_000562, partial [Ceratobasidium sp. 370]